MSTNNQDTSDNAQSEKASSDNTQQNDEHMIVAPAQPRSFSARLRAYFLTGIFVTAPVTITLYLAYIFFSAVDGKVRELMPSTYDALFVYENFTIPGVGVLIAFISFVVIGFLASNIMGKFFIRIGEYILERIPVIRNLYSTIKQIFETISTSQSQAFREVVMLEYPRKGVWSVGFVTGTSKGEVQERVSNETVNVFLPTTPNPTSGFLLFVPRKELKFLDMTVEEGIKLVVSAGIITPPHGKEEKEAAKKKKSKKGLLGK